MPAEFSIPIAWLAVIVTLLESVIARLSQFLIDKCWLVYSYISTIDKGPELDLRTMHALFSLIFALFELEGAPDLPSNTQKRRASMRCVGSRPHSSSLLYNCPPLLWLSPMAGYVALYIDFGADFYML